ncbi:hypothetical protein [Dokdonella fugitiva]|jgi:hypothetical protein|uniref:Uncharacterized protein n=1 Tax=Dokdonella fugitiva TaxID=328517 RepID=A0A4R2I8F5_9GAMM|nr:hypothetical protein [Dokdonella fugitiva]TCO40236.1 hypothetical protein EV148_10530 [Dokdonella fugitiva]
MNHANEVLLLITALVAVPSLVAGTMYWTHRRGLGVVMGWGGRCSSCCAESLRFC